VRHRRKVDAVTSVGRRTAIHVGVITTVVAALCAVTVLVVYQTGDAVLIAYWLLGALVIMFCLLAFLIGRRFTDLPIAPGRVLAIVPAYNEDPRGLHKTVKALVEQTVDVDIVVIDDGSKNPVVPSLIHPRVRWMAQENTGKRGAQVAVLREFDRNEYDFILTVDSDSEPYPDAAEQLLRSMSNPKVQASTGMIYIRNYEDSWVSRAADIDIGTSCVMMRASRSMLGSLETTSGALALYRSCLLYDNLEEYAVECGTGDDRWLALRALRIGEVVGVAEALVETDMPSTMKGTYRQRLRWARSWWWMLPYVFSYLGPKQLLSPIFGLVQLVLTPLIFLYIILSATLSWQTRYSDHLSILGIYAGAYVIVRYGLSALYLVGRPRMSGREKFISWVVGTPAAVFLNMILLVPTRYIALFKLFDNRWQTREEVPNAHPGAVVDLREPVLASAHTMQVSADARSSVAHSEEPLDTVLDLTDQSFAATRFR